MKMGLRTALGMAVVIGVAIIIFTFQRPPIDTVQRGFRGTGMQQNYDPRLLRANFDINQAPAPQPAQEPLGQPSSQAYQNVKVLGDVDAGEFLRLMTAITAWVSPTQGCNYCHNAENYADDSLYTKRVARRMIQMVRHINANWQSHVAGVGVTCYTCHRGQPVPAAIWFNDPGPEQPRGGFAETGVGKNLPSLAAGYASLPYDPFTPFLENASQIRVQGTTALPTGNRQSIKQTDWTYALMIHFSQALGVNCTYCHEFAGVLVLEPEHAPARDRLVWDPDGARPEHGLHGVPGGHVPARAARANWGRRQDQLHDVPPRRLQAALRRQHGERLQGAGNGRRPGGADLLLAADGGAGGCSGGAGEVGYAKLLASTLGREQLAESITAEE